MTKKVWFITGTAKGLGYLIARDALRAGDKVVATSRTVDGLGDRLAVSENRLLVLPLDVTDADAVAEAHDAAIKTFGHIDVLINNAGRAQLGFFETIRDDDVRRQFEINVFGAMNVARAVLPTAVGSDGDDIFSERPRRQPGWVDILRLQVCPRGLDGGPC